MVSYVLLITSFIFLVSSILFLVKGKSKQSKLSTIALGIAGIMYGIMSYLYSYDTEVNLRVLRYFDWGLTIPILLYQMYLHMNVKSQTIGTFISAVVCMMFVLVFGFSGEIGWLGKVSAGLLGIMFSIYTFLTMVNGIGDNNIKFYIITFGVWMFYPIAYFLSDTTFIIILYSVIDIAAKLGMDLYLYLNEEL